MPPATPPSRTQWWINLASDADDWQDRWRTRWRQRRGQPALPRQLVAYRGLGNDRQCYLRGRVLGNPVARLSLVGDSAWQNLCAMVSRFFSDEVPNVRVQAVFCDQQREVTTDKEGFFEVHFAWPTTALGPALWQEVALELPEARSVRAAGWVMLANPASRLGIISDVDDTILQSKITSKWRMLQLVFFRNAYTRLAFEGVADFYQMLQGGADGRAQNPIVYVSSSPWNLYDFLVEFCRVNRIPDGPFLLRDLGFDRDKFFKTGHLTHKLEKIALVLDLQAPLPFLLIGDSGQHDPEIYCQAVRDFPGRIRAIYIRDVSGAGRGAQVRHLADQLRQDTGVELVLFRDTAQAQAHALAHGFV